MLPVEVSMRVTWPDVSATYNGYGEPAVKSSHGEAQETLAPTETGHPAGCVPFAVLTPYTVPLPLTANTWLPSGVSAIDEPSTAASIGKYQATVGQGFVGSAQKVEVPL